MRILVTGGRDSVARVWDMRTKMQVHVLSGHTNTVGAKNAPWSTPSPTSFTSALPPNNNLACC